MKRKPSSEQESVVPKALLDHARKSLEGDKLPRHPICRVCGEDVAPFSQEELCWVCRRLKISAWGDSDTQMSAQE